MKFFFCRKKIANQNSIYQDLEFLLSQLGFTSTIKKHVQGIDIIGIANKKNRLNFFIRILSHTVIPSNKEKEEYTEYFQHIKNTYHIERDFLIYGDEYIHKDGVDSILVNPSFTQALVLVADPGNQYVYLSKIGAHMHAKQTIQVRIHDIQYLFGLPVSEVLLVLQECPFIKWTSNKQFEFVHFEFQNYFLAHEFSLYEKAALQKKLTFEEYWEIQRYISYSQAPSIVQEIILLVKKINDLKYNYADEKMYEVAAMLRDYEKLLHEKFLFTPWPHYSTSTIDEVERNVAVIFYKIGENDTNISKDPRRLS